MILYHTSPTKGFGVQTDEQTQQKKNLTPMIWVNAFTRLETFWGTKLLGVSVGRGSGLGL